MSVAIPPSIKWGVIGLGRCGGNLAEEFYLRGYPTIIFNSSQTDLRAGRLPTEKLLYIGMSERDGAGQDIEMGDRCLLTHANRILEKSLKELGDVESIILTGGLGGGTGSSLGTLARILSDLGLPMSALASIPWDGEGSIVKVNAIRALNKLVYSPVNSISLIDNQKIFTEDTGGTLSELYLNSNRNVVSIFDEINRISRNPAYRPLIGFDSEDLRKFFFSRGLTIISKIDLTETDFEHYEAIVDKVINSWKAGGRFCAGYDFTQATLASTVILASKTILQNTPAVMFEKTLAEIKDYLISIGLYSGIFQTSEHTAPCVFTMVAGLPMPETIDRLTEQARSEGKILTLKSGFETEEIDLRDLAGINLFRVLNKDNQTKIASILNNTAS